MLLCLGVGGTLLAPLPVAQASTDPAAQMLLGNPDKATTSPTNRQRFLMKRGQFALSYNETLHFPNWVAWHLDAGDIGDTERGQFQPDPDLPQGFTQITTRDYTGSGYDRGHNCPSKDRSASRQDNDATFFMTNTTPQQHGMNAGPWNGLEDYCRKLAQEGNELYIQCGHGFTDKKPKVLGRAGIAIPNYGWKIVVVLPRKSGNDLARINAQTRVIAVRMPNISTISKQDWQKYTVTVKELESATGLSFFDALPANIATTLKLKKDGGPSIKGNELSIKGRGPSISDSRDGIQIRNIPAPNRGIAGYRASDVWVNTKSGVYWRPGTRYFGKTKEGKYMSEADAKKAGYRAAGGQ